MTAETDPEASIDLNAKQAAGAISIDHVSKSFGDVLAVDEVSLEIAAGEFFSLLGPSGCGKTTTLRLVAGFEFPTSGRIIVGGQDVTRQRPAIRPLNMVFQDYALFPHLDVRDNIAFGLRVKKVAKTEAADRVAEVISTMRLDGLADRRPAQLSGGQRQRVALARALVNRPRALLLDEPLGALDLQLRKQMQTELRRVHQQTGTTFLYVTHDQEEALTMSDRIAVMHEGKVEQLADPRTMYERPASAFVAEFIGTSNLLVMKDCRFVDGLAVSQLTEGQRLTAWAPASVAATDLQVTVRPERVALYAQPPESAIGTHSLVKGIVTDFVYLGSLTQVTVELLSGARLVVHKMSDDPSLNGVRPGGAVVLTWAPDGAHVIGPAHTHQPAA